jgi:hypothetical protein
VSRSAGKKQNMPGSQYAQNLKTISFDDLIVQLIQRLLLKKEKTGGYEVERDGHAAHNVLQPEV